MTRKARIVVIVIYLLGFAIVSNAPASKFAATPLVRFVYSANGSHRIQLDPVTRIHEVQETGSSRALWQFSLDEDFGRLAVANNGRRVIWIAWKYLRQGEEDKACVSVFEGNGTKKIYRCSQFGTPRTIRSPEVGPIGSFWRVWCESVTIGDGEIAITTADDRFVTIPY